MARGFLVKRFFRLGRFSLSVGVCGGERRLDGTGNFAFLGVAEVWWWQVSNTLAAQQPVFLGRLLPAQDRQDIPSVDFLSNVLHTVFC